MTKTPPSFQLSKEMINLTQSIMNDSRNKNHEAEKSSVEQGAEQNNLKEEEGIIEEESLVESDEKDKSSDSVKKDEGFIVGILKALIKMMGGTIDEDGKEEEKNKSNALDELKKLIFGDNSKGNVVESEFVNIPSPDSQNQNLEDSETLTQTQNSIPDQDSNRAPTPPSNPRPAPAPAPPPPPPHPRPAPSPTQNRSDQDQDQDPNQTPNPTSNQNEEKGENNDDKLITKIIVGIYEKEGKLNLLKQILNDEKGKEENKNNSKMKNLIKGFESEIAEREQAAGKYGKDAENSKEVENSKDEVESKGEGVEVKPEGVEVKPEEVEVKPEEVGVKPEDAELDSEKIPEDAKLDSEKIIVDEINEFDAPKKTFNERNQNDEVASKFTNEVINADNKESDQLLSVQPEEEPKQGLENVGDEDNQLVNLGEGDLMDLEAIAARFDKIDFADVDSRDISKQATAISKKAAQENEKEGQGRQ